MNRNIPATTVLVILRCNMELTSFSATAVLHFKNRALAILAATQIAADGGAGTATASTFPIKK
ncbi:hypothetical protein [Janthinobacterium sp. PSPC3-1]|uniref:hypothetical protein n=1 Tax=Janthinobacterium sp. PSPC3-1 TaxID=2804653 RepID=UPI003CF52E3B